ncbi:serine/threonine-protein kinase [Paenibacillus mucilaginosus]|uniref:serine/threonine protein kinase n=1 Tax=Paenibacillus mucilaginosus TaxID=61624 RepID=UPI003D25BA32
MVRLNSGDFPGGVQDKSEWTDLISIVDILRKIGEYPDTNHTFPPRGGGFDLTGAVLSDEHECIELLSGGSTFIAKPAKLVFNAPGTDPQFHYFRLETRELKPSGVYKGVAGGYEEVCELSPGQYVDRSIWDHGYYGLDENGYDKPLPKEARPVIREFNGAFVVFGKYSYYNRLNGTYDGIHNKMSGDSFYKQIVQLAELAATNADD